MSPYSSAALAAFARFGRKWVRVSVTYEARAMTPSGAISSSTPLSFFTNLPIAVDYPDPSLSELPGEGHPRLPGGLGLLSGGLGC